MTDGGISALGAVSGVGVDIIEMSRFRSVRYPLRIAELVFTEEELALYRAHPAPLMFLASRFAAKEAVIKASLTPLTYRDIEIIKEGEKPAVTIRNVDTRTHFFVSLSHSEDYVASFAVAKPL